VQGIYGPSECSFQHGSRILRDELKDGTFESRELFNRAELLIRKGDYSKATILLNEAIKIAPSNATYLSHLGLCIGMQGNLPAAESMCRKALQMEPFEPIHFVNLGRVLLEQGRRKEARLAFMRAYELDNTNAPAALELSRMGIRRKPVLPFLPRNNPLNVYLGKLRHRLVRLMNERKNKFA